MNVALCRWIGLMVVAMLVFAACGGSDSGGEVPILTTPQAVATETDDGASATDTASGDAADPTEDPAVATDTTTAPTLTLPAIQDVIDAVAAGVTAT